MNFMRKIFGRDVSAAGTPVEGQTLRVATDTDTLKWEYPLDAATNVGLTLTSTGTNPGDYEWAADQSGRLFTISYSSTTAPYAYDAHYQENIAPHDFEGAKTTVNIIDYAPPDMSYVATASGSSATLGAVTRNGKRVRISGMFTMGSYLAQSDSSWPGGAPFCSLKIYSDADVLLATTELTALAHSMEGVHASNDVVCSVQYFVDKWVHLSLAADSLPTTLKVSLRGYGDSTGGGGSAALQILSIENFNLSVFYK